MVTTSSWDPQRDHWCLHSSYPLQLLLVFLQSPIILPPDAFLCCCWNDKTPFSGVLKERKRVKKWQRRIKKITNLEGWWRFCTLLCSNAALGRANVNFCTLNASKIKFSFMCPFQRHNFSAGCKRSRSCGKISNLRRYFQQKWEVKWLQGYYCLKPHSKSHPEKEMSSREITQPGLWKQELNFYTWLPFPLELQT